MRPYRLSSSTRDLTQKSFLCMFSWLLGAYCCFFLLSVFYPRAKGARSLPIRKLLKPEQQMMTSIMNGFHAQPFEPQLAIKPALARGRETVTLGPIRINRTHSEFQTSQITSYNKKQNISENVGNSDTPISKFKAQIKDNPNSSKHLISYQQQYRYQTYFEQDNRNKLQYTSKNSYSQRKSLPESSFFFGLLHEIAFLNGSPRSKISNCYQQKKHRLMINNLFYFAKKMFQSRIAQIINLSLHDKFRRISINLAAILISQKQSLTFKFFLPPI